MSSVKFSNSVQCMFSHNSKELQFVSSLLCNISDAFYLQYIQYMKFAQTGWVRECVTDCAETNSVGVWYMTPRIQMCCTVCYSTVSNLSKVFVFLQCKEKVKKFPALYFSWFYCNSIQPNIHRLIIPYYVDVLRYCISC